MRNLLISVAALAVATPATAGTLLFNNSGSTDGYTRSYSDGTVSVSILGLSLNSHGGLAAIGAPQYWSGNGLGIQAPYDQHTIDNKNGVDFLLMTFNKSVALTGAGFVNQGWDGIVDTDASISYANYDFAAHGMSYNNAFYGSNFGTFLNGVTPALNGNMFESTTFRNYSSVRSFNDGINTGTTWLIGASFKNLDKKADAFKLSGVAYQLPVLSGGGGAGAVPEPATWAMLILGMGAVGGAMRRRNQGARKVRAAINFA